MDDDVCVTALIAAYRGAQQAYEARVLAARIKGEPVPELPGGLQYISRPIA